MATLTSKNLFVGYSSLSSPRGQQLADIKLVEQDLLNHFNTRRDERVMMPGWGCGIWDYLFEPMSTAREGIVFEAQKVIDSDPRVQLTDINVTEWDHGIRIDMTLYYVPFRAVGSFSINFDRRSLEMS